MTAKEAIKWAYRMAADLVSADLRAGYIPPEEEPDREAKRAALSKVVKELERKGRANGMPCMSHMSYEEVQQQLAQSRRIHEEDSEMQQKLLADAIGQRDALQRRLDEVLKENEELRKHQIPQGWICHP